MATPGTLNRREFTASIAGLSISPFLPVPDDDGPILDLHQHTLYTGRTHEQLLAHQAAHRITTTVLLPGEGWMLEQLGGNRACTELQAGYPDKFIRFACADAAESRAIDVLRDNIRGGAIGIGEMKFQVGVDSPEMHWIYRLAEEMKVPVLIHFEHQNYNTGIERFEKILRSYPNVNFIGHAQTWWGHISADLDPLVMYPKGRVKPGGLTDDLLSNYPNIYGDLSAGSGLNSITRDPDFARGFLARHSHHLIWGSDCNCHDGRGAGIQRESCIAEESLKALKELVPDPAAFRRIVYENGARLLARI